MSVVEPISNIRTSTYINSIHPSSSLKRPDEVHSCFLLLSVSIAQAKIHIVTVDGRAVIQLDANLGDIIEFQIVADVSGILFDLLISRILQFLIPRLCRWRANNRNQLILRLPTALFFIAF